MSLYNVWCCNLSGGVELNVWFTTNEICVKNNTIHTCGANKQYKSDRGVEALPISTCEPLNVTTSVCGEWSWHVNCIVACCHTAKLCAHAARDFQSQHSFVFGCLPCRSSAHRAVSKVLLRPGRESNSRPTSTERTYHKTRGWSSR